MINPIACVRAAAEAIGITASPGDVMKRSSLYGRGRGPGIGAALLSWT